MGFTSDSDDQPSATPSGSPKALQPKNYVKNLVDVSTTLKPAGSKRGYAGGLTSEVAIHKTARRKGVRQKLTIKR